VVLLSPELAGFTDPRYGDFSSGNVLDRPLHGSSRTPPGADRLDRRIPHRGRRRAGRTARTSASVAAPHAANRYFEHGRFDGTQTDHCRNSKIHLLEGYWTMPENTEPLRDRVKAAEPGLARLLAEAEDTWAARADTMANTRAGGPSRTPSRPSTSSPTARGEAHACDGAHT